MNRSSLSALAPVASLMGAVLVAVTGCGNSVIYGDTGGAGGAGPHSVAVVSVAHSTGTQPNVSVSTGDVSPQTNVSVGNTYPAVSTSVAVSTGYYPDSAVSTGYYPDSAVSTGYYPNSAVSTGYYPNTSGVTTGYNTNVACFPWYGGEGGSVTSTTGVNVAVAVATGYYDGPPCPDVNVAQGYFESVCSATIVYGPGYFDSYYERCCYPVSEWPCVDSSSTGYTSGSGYSSSTY